MLHPELSAEVARRRTFAIISHPDAGKTTLTEKLLLYGGAIRQAGSVKARKTARHATSDWMEIEKQRGISVTSSAMQFDYNGYRINILDTPGHQDFSEDTYRTLVAADSAVMLIDNAKGVEEQTIKLFKVCRLRSIPIFTFVNKMDRAGRDPFELMEELENVLGIRSCPVNWPIGIHGDFKGVFHRDTRLVELYAGGDHGQTQVDVRTVSIDDPECETILGRSYYQKLQEDNAPSDDEIQSYYEENKATYDSVDYRLTTIEALVGQIEENSAGRVQAYSDKLYARLQELLGDRNIDEGRLVTEAAIFADKTAIDEETVRLRSHIEGMKTELLQGGSIGRKLDFIAQEMNREANTILSKANDLQTSNLAINLKTEIEKVREQIQNIE